MTNRQQSVYFFLIVFLFATGAGLLVYKNYNDFYQEQVQIDLTPSALPAVLPQFNSKATTTGSVILNPVDETGPETICKTNDDCWCRNFDGAKFSPGKAPSICNTQTNRCVACFYE